MYFISVPRAPIDPYAIGGQPYQLLAAPENSNNILIYITIPLGAKLFADRSDAVTGTRDRSRGWPLSVTDLKLLRRRPRHTDMARAFAVVSPDQ